MPGSSAMPCADWYRRARSAEAGDASGGEPADTECMEQEARVRSAARRAHTEPCLDGSCVSGQAGCDGRIARPCSPLWVHAYVALVVLAVVMRLFAPPQRRV